MFYETPMVNIGDEEVLDKMRIRELVEYDRYCTDYGFKEEQRKLWFEDGRLFTTWFNGSVGEYLGNPVTAPKEADEGEPGEMHGHRINNTVIWLNGNRAVAELLAFLNFRTKLAWEWMDSQCWCRFHYRVEKRGGKWGLVYFEGIYEKDRMDPVFLDSDFNIPREVLMKYRSINWNMSVRRGEFLGGLKNADLWAGADKPETITRLYEESSRWFFENTNRDTHQEALIYSNVNKSTLL